MSAFVDTNVLVYAADESSPAPRKTQVARELLLQRDLHLSVQVLNEFTVNARNPRKLDLSKAAEKEWIDRWLLFPVHPLGIEQFHGARRIHERHGISHWDALIVATAIDAGCDLVYSEDLQNGRNYSGVQVVNPFLH
jgi:predicted nucleic acid-binding protein